jgi:YidC/Oxa1 family membrane protein insertase
MQRSPSTFPLPNFVLFVALSFLILIAHFLWMNYTNPRKPLAANVAQAEKDKADKDKQAKPGDKKPDVAGAKKPPAEKPEASKEKEKTAEKPAKSPDAKTAKGPPQPKFPSRWVTLGSADAEASNPYRMLVTLSSRGAAVARIELSSPRYHDLDDRGGYLGHLVMEMDNGLQGTGCPVQVVGEGTPAAKAGLKPGDLIEAVDGKTIAKASDLEKLLRKKKPKQNVELTVLRKKEGKDAELKLTATLGWRPLEVVRPEDKNPDVIKAGVTSPDSIWPDETGPLSMLGTLQQIDADSIPEEEKAGEVELEAELPGVHLRNENWQVVKADGDEAVFRQTLPAQGLEITRTYRLAKVPGDKLANADFPAYHLDVSFEIKNVGAKTRKVAYRLDGPNGLPTEGWWYGNKVSRNWGGCGMRDVLVRFGHSDPQMVSCYNIAEGKVGPAWQDESLTFIGVDAQYFSTVLIPQGDTANAIYQSMPVRVGETDPSHQHGHSGKGSGASNITNTSFRLIGKARDLRPGEKLEDSFRLFAGPKKPDLLAGYDLGDVLYYGWFYWVAKPMLWTLHTFYWAVRNYGLAIIMLTVLVRLCMFPLGRKQALNAQKMQELQPEIKKLQEKYKSDVEARTKAQQELFRKHNYNPLSGCLVVFIQLPIFVGLYRSLMVDVELRDAPLISEAVRWCSNLAAPDMLFNWSSFMFDTVTRGVGFFGLGPYLNILPLFTIVLFIVQQKMFMPPATDEQSAMQQKVMQYMMIFMGLMFFKVASGLCLYFIASSLWGLAERKLLPKTSLAGGDDDKDAPDKPWRSPSRRDIVAQRRNRNRGK